MINDPLISISEGGNINTRKENVNESLQVIKLEDDIRKRVDEISCYCVTSSIRKSSALDDIFNVGPKKPVGYLPIETIEDILKVDIGNIADIISQKGNRFELFFGQKWPGSFRGCIYAYDELSLQNLLDENRQILLDENWPQKAEDFVRNLHVMTRIGTPIFKLIAKSFGDKISEQME